MLNDRQSIGSFGPRLRHVIHRLFAGAALAGLFQSVSAQVVSTNGTVAITNTSGTVIVTATIENNSGSTFTNDGAIELSDIDNAGTMNGNGTLTVDDTFTNSGTFTPGTGTVIFSGTTSQLIPDIDFGNLVITGAGTTTLSATSSIAGDLTLSGGTFDLATFEANRTAPGGTFTMAAGCTVRVGGTGTSLPSQFSDYVFDPSSVVEFYGSDHLLPGGTYDHLTATASGATVTVTSQIDMEGDFAFEDGILDLGPYTADRTTSGGTLTLGAGATLKIGGTNPMPVNYTTYSFDPVSTVEFSGTDHTIGAFDFSNLSVSASGTITLPNGGTIGIAGSFTPGVAAYITTGSTIDYNLNGDQSVAAFAYHHLTLSGGGVKTFQSDSTRISGTLSLSGVTVDAATNFSVIKYDGSSAQTVTPMIYFDLVCGNTGMKSISGTVTADRDVFIEAGTTLEIGGSGDLTVHRDVDNSGIFNIIGILTVVP